MKTNNRYGGWSEVLSCLLALSVLVCGCARHSGPDAAALAFDYHMKGDEFLRAGQYGAALNELQKAAQLEPNFWPTRYRLARAYDGTGQIAQAIAEYQKVIALKPPFRNPADGANIYLRLGQDLYKLGQREEARTQWRQAIVIAAQDKTHSKKIRQVEHQARMLLSDTTAKTPRS